MIKLVVDDKIPYLKGVLEPIANVVFLPGSKITRDDLMDADALFTRTRTKCNAALLECTNVKFIATATIGYDHIDTNFCDSKGIKWTNAPGCNSSSVQQYIASALLFLCKKHNFKLEHRSLGVVGVGNVGKKVVKLAEAMGLKVLLNDPPRARMEGSCGFVISDTIIKECDIITFHVPLNKEGDDMTKYLADGHFFTMLRPDTIIINTSRGPVVNNDVLKLALKEKRIAGAILDVWEHEPDIDIELMNLLDIATPHIAGYSYDGKANGTAMSVQALSKFFNLGLDNWYPSGIEKPQNLLLNIDCKGKLKEEVLYEIFSSSYNIEADDKRLRASVANFEKQRGDYPLRRELDAYTVNLLNDDHNFKTILSNLINK